MPMWFGELTISIALFVFAIVFYLISGNFPEAMNPADVGPAAFPELMAGFVIILSTAQLLFSFIKPPKKKVYFEKLLLVSVLVLTTIYMYFMPLLGYFYTTPVFVFSLMLLLGNRKWMQLMLITAAFSLFAYYVFYKFLRVNLPL